MEIPNSIIDIEKMSWDSLRRLAIQELDTVPKEEHIAFETLFKAKWPEFRQMILSLVNKSYPDIRIISENMAMLGDFSSKEALALANIATLNTVQLESPKVEFLLICRYLHTK